MINIQLAPIVFFVYNRLYHTQRTLDALAANTLAKDSELYVYADGPKNSVATIACKELRQYLHDYKDKNESSFKHIHIIERANNFGLAKNISEGVSEIVNKFGRVIVVEDDIVTSPYALKFLNEALAFYEKEKKVYHIAGWNELLSLDIKEDAFLWRAMNCWLWATWKDRWQIFHMDTPKMFGDFNAKDIKRFNKDNTETGQWGIVQAVQSKKINTWDIFWYGAIFKEGGLCLNPKVSLARNIGTDYSGTHCDEQLGYLNQEISQKHEWTFPKKIVEHKLAFTQMKQYNIHERTEKLNMSETIRQCTVQNKIALFKSLSEDKHIDNERLVRTLKNRLRQYIKKLLNKIFPPYSLLVTTRNKTTENEKRIIELEHNQATQIKWMQGMNFPKIQRYLNNSVLLARYLNIFPETLEILLEYIETNKPKTILEIGCGTSTALLASIQKAQKGTLISYDHNKARLDNVATAIHSCNIEDSVKLNSTQVIFQKIDGLQWFCYDFRYFSKNEITNIDLLILDEPVEYIQEYSTYAFILLLEPFISNATTIITNRLSSKTKELIPIWEKYLLNKNTVAKFIEL